MPLLNSAAIFLAATVIAVPLCRKLGLGSVLGYLIAGIVLGPWGLRVVRDGEATLHVAEFGVVLLLFVIGLELQPSRLRAMHRTVFGLGLAQVVVTSAVFGFIAHLMGLALPAAIANVTPAAIALRTAVSSAVEAPPPRLMFATAGLTWFALTQSTPAITPELLPDPPQLSTRTANSLTLFATPWIDPPTVPATCVP